MILVDDQSGSKDLFPYIRSLTADCLLTRIDPPFGDMVWDGNGPDETKPLRVAVEYKKFDEILDHIVGGGGRFTGHQVGRLVEFYDRRYLLVEGRIRVDRNTGIVQKLRGRDWDNISRGGNWFTSRDLEHWVTTIEEQAQFRVRFTYDEYESARYVVNKWSWYTSKGWEDHSALKQFHVPPPPTVNWLQRPSLIRRIAKELWKIGWDKSLAVEQKFGTVREMINANEATWREIPGIGKEIASRVVAEVSQTSARRT